MIRKTAIFLFIIVLSLGAFSRSRPASDTVRFTPTVFSSRLDYLYSNQLKSSLVPYEKVNGSMLACVNPPAPSEETNLISRKMEAMNTVVRLGSNPKVLEFLDILLYKRPGAACLLLSLSNYYMPIFTSVFEKYGIPVELAYLPSVISSYDPASIAPFGSTGLWNMMYLSGKLYNLEINSMVDERKNVEKSTEAAARQLRDLNSIYNDWTLALTAYVTGPAVVNKAIRRAGGKQDFWDIYPYLPVELRDYIPAFSAMNFFIRYHDDFGFKPLTVDLPARTDTVLICRELHLQEVSKALDIPMATLRTLNPQFRTDILPAVSKSYILNLPESYGEKFRQVQTQVFACSDSAFCRVRTANAASSASAGMKGIAGSKGASGSIYTVRSGESLSTIARKFNVSVTSIKSWNHLKTSTIHPGQKLVISPSRESATGSKN